MLEKKKKAIKICDRILAILVMWIWVNQNQGGFFEEAKGIGKKKMKIVSLTMTSWIFFDKFSVLF